MWVRDCLGPDIKCKDGKANMADFVTDWLKLPSAPRLRFFIRAAVQVVAPLMTAAHRPVTWVCDTTSKNLRTQNRWPVAPALEYPT